MNKDTIGGDFKTMKGKIKAQWGKLTDDDLKRIEGKSEELAGRVQKAYGLSKDEAENQVREFQSKIKH